MDASDKQLDLLTDKFINENVNQVVVVDDIFYNKSNYFPDQTFINNNQLDDLNSHYPKFINDDEKKWSKAGFIFFNILLFDRFKDLFRSAVPSKEIMELKYGNLNKFKLYKIYISRIISLIFNRNNNT